MPLLLLPLLSLLLLALLSRACEGGLCLRCVRFLLARELISAVLPLRVSRPVQSLQWRCKISLEGVGTEIHVPNAI